MSTKKDFLYLLILAISVFLIYAGWSMRPLGCDDKSSVKIIKAAARIEDYSKKIAMVLGGIIVLVYLIMRFKPSFIANSIDFVKNKTNTDVFNFYMVILVLLIVCLVSWYVSKDIKETISEKADDFSDDVEYLSFVSLLYSSIGVFFISLIFGLEFFPTLVSISDNWKKSIMKDTLFIQPSQNNTLPAPLI